MGFERHLSPWEILAQPRELLLRPDGARPSNIVFMGMGEPLHNWSAVDTALTVLNYPGGFGIGARRITVSTVGIVPKLLELARRPEQFRVALSLHAPTSEKRAMLMPVERKYPLDDVLRALETFRKRVTFEYVMISEVNDSADDAGRLAELARPLGALINLLPLHPGGAPDLQPTPLARMMWFADLLRDLGAQATVRRSRGLDISAACGQLRVETEHLRGIASEEHTHVQQ
jgi:23S rRNA (adenine2503-C2)-methyltransferase